MTVVHDVLEKARQMAIAGHKVAATIVDEFEERQTKLENTSDVGAIKRSLEFERAIIDFAQKDLEIIDSLQASELKRIQIDRNRSAHPSYQKIDTLYQPTAELARTHIRCAVDQLLSAPPVQGRFVLDRVISVIESKYFPSDLQEVSEALRIAGLVRPSQPLVKSISHHSISKLLSSDSYGANSQKYSSVLSVLGGLSADFEHLILQPMLNQLIHNFSDPEIGKNLTRIVRLKKLHKMLDPVNVKRLQTAFLQLKLADDPYLVELGLLSDLFKSNAEVLVRIATVQDLATFFEWDVLFAEEGGYSPQKAIMKRAAILYGQSTSFEAANNCFGILMKEHLGLFNTETLIEFLHDSLVQEGDIVGSFSLDGLAKVIKSRDDFSLQLINAVLGAKDTDKVQAVLVP